jgi:hypothetical protein
MRYLLNLPGFFLMAAVLLFSTNLPAAESNPVDFALIQKHAMFAQATYQSEDDIRTSLAASGYMLTLFHTFPGTQVFFLLATNEMTKTQVVAVRGTSNIENAMVDIYLQLVVDKKTGVALHHGFSVAARQVYAKIKPFLKRDYKIDVTGHSLGGAVALILAMYLDADQFEIEQVTTFGQPKVTNIAGADKIGHINIIRVVTPADLVPLVPLFDPLDINKLDVFWHAGKEVILLTGNQYAILEGTESMLRASNFTQKLLSQENLQHHQMTLYLKMIKAKTQSAELVPYQINYNFFNLFGSE